MQQKRMEIIETYVQKTMAKPLLPELMIAHDFKHVDRVRSWALYLAQKEGYQALDILEATALLHDIGLPYVDHRNKHAAVGAEVAAQFLREASLFSGTEIEEITEAIRLHSSLHDGSPLLYLLRDADTLDLLGAVGIMRAFASKYAKPEYDPANIKGDTWGMSGSHFTQRFTEGVGVGHYMIDQLNFQISCFGNLRTESAKEVARPLIEFMKIYILQLESEIKAHR